MPLHINAVAAAMLIAASIAAMSCGSAPRHHTRASRPAPAQPPTSASTTMFSDEAKIFAVPVNGGPPSVLSRPVGEHHHGDGSSAGAGHEHDEEIQVDNPIWSPDGTRIAFTRTPCEYCPPELYVMNKDGAAQRRLSRLRNTYQPTWSPNGRRLGVLLPGRRSGLYSVDPEAGVSRRILTDRAAIEAPSWSRTRDEIVYARQVTATNWDIYATDPAGRSRRRLTRSRSQETTPEWSPDGRRIALTRQRANGNWAIYTMRGDGTQIRPVTDGRQNAVEPTWSPEGDRIAFTLQPRHDRSTIAIVDARGGAVRAITDASLFATQPAWSPDGRTIAFAARAVTHITN